MEPTQPPATQAPTTTPPPPTKPPTDGRRTEPVTMQRPVATNVSDTSLSTGGFLRCLSALYGGNVLAEQTGDFAEYSAYAGILKTFTYVHSPDYLTEKGLLAPITRAEVAYVMACALQSHPSLGFRHFMNQMVIDNSITDCDTLIIDSDVYAIYFVVKYNLMSVTDGNFRPYDALSVDEMNQIILELLAI